MTSHDLRAEVVRPSELGATELATWRQLQARNESLQRAFLTPTFAQVSERANGRAYVAVLHHGGTPCGFFAFQFASVWHQRLRLAERIGGGLSDAAGVVASPDLRITSSLLLRLARLSSLSITHLVAGQEVFGLDAVWSRVGHITDLRDGPDAYFAALLQRDRILVRDTERRMRKAETSYGPLSFTRNAAHIPDAMIAQLIEQKRQQYHRTQVVDALASSASVRLIAAMNEAPTDECCLVMSRLQAGERVLAQHLGPQYRDILSHWFPVYDPEARNVSPGRLLLWQMIQRAREDGISLIDYGEGDAVYKQEFSTGKTRYGGADWSSGDVRSMLARVWQGVEWRVRQRRQGAPKQATAAG